MADLEKTIESLQEQIDWIRENDFHKFPGWGHTVLVMGDALELLKERVKTKVVFGRNKDGSFETECGNCGTYLDKAYSRCPKCNRELDWNSNQN